MALLTLRGHLEPANETFFKFASTGWKRPITVLMENGNLTENCLVLRAKPSLKT